MNMNEYQKRARKTAIYPRTHAIIYPALGLAGETGECVEKVKKMLRDDAGNLTPECREAICKDLGDVLWYVANLATDCQLTLEDIATVNVLKLEDRQNRGTLKGSGDNI